MSIGGFFIFFKRALGFLLFPFFVLSNIYLAIIMEPFEEMRSKKKWLYFLLFPLVIIPWAVNFIFFGLWEKLLE